MFKKKEVRFCNLCGCEDWGDFAGRQGIACKSCGSLERTRLAFLHLERLGLPTAETRVLHIAPEPGLARVFSRVCGENYFPVDFNPARYASLGAKKFDLCVDAPKLESESYDLIIHNHVLEHIFCDVTTILYHLHRALTPTGRHIFSVPFFPNKHYDEFMGPLSDEESTARFGQYDHCRTYSLPDLDRTIGMTFNRDLRTFRPDRQFSAEQLDRINFPEASRQRLNGDSIISVERADLIFFDS